MNNTQAITEVAKDMKQYLNSLLSFLESGYSASDLMVDASCVQEGMEKLNELLWERFDREENTDSIDDEPEEVGFREGDSGEYDYDEIGFDEVEFDTAPF